MKIEEDVRKRAALMIDLAISQRNYAQQLWDDAEQMLIEARLLLEDLEKEEDHVS